MPSFTVIGLMPTDEGRYQRVADAIDATDQEMAQVVAKRNRENEGEMLIAGVLEGDAKLLDQAMYADEEG